MVLVKIDKCRFCFSSFQPLFNQLLKYGHIPGDRFKDLIIPFDIDIGRDTIHQFATNAQNSWQRTKVLLYPYQVAMKQVPLLEVNVEKNIHMQATMNKLSVNVNISNQQCVY